MAGTINDMRDLVRRQCDEGGISVAKGLVRSYEHDKFMAGVVLTWIDEYERREAAVETAEQRRLTKESLDAAKDAAATSKEAAVASQRSATWTMWAAIAAAISAAVPFLQAVGVLPK